MPSINLVESWLDTFNFWISYAWFQTIKSLVPSINLVGSWLDTFNFWISYAWFQTIKSLVPSINLVGSWLDTFNFWISYAWFQAIKSLVPSINLVGSWLDTFNWESTNLVLPSDINLLLRKMTDLCIFKGFVCVVLYREETKRLHLRFVYLDKEQDVRPN